MSQTAQRAKSRALGLFLREGIFHAVIEFPLAGFSLEVALHGIDTLEEALAAVHYLV